MQHNYKAAANNVTSFVNHFLDLLLSAYYAEAKLDVYRLLVLSDRKFKTQEYSVHCHKVQKTQQMFTFERSERVDFFYTFAQEISKLNKNE